MPQIEVYDHPHSRNENGRAIRYQPGDQFEGTETELLAFSDRLRRVDDDEEKEA